LLESAGIDFDEHRDKGIAPHLFSKLFRKSELVFNNRVAWVSYNGRFDFAYLIQLVDMLPLPTSEASFVSKCTQSLRRFYDVKLLVSERHSLHHHLSQEGIGLPQKAHQAGSDSISTLKLFYRVHDRLVEQNKQIEENKITCI